MHRPAAAEVWGFSSGVAAGVVASVAVDSEPDTTER
jgi:hypothetical protein